MKKILVLGALSLASLGVHADSELISGLAGRLANSVTTKTLTVTNGATISPALPVSSGGTGANTAAGALAALGATPIITANTTLNVPAQYASIQSALDYLGTVAIAKGVTVTVKVADGTYSWSNIEPKTPYGDQIQVIGDIANPAAAVINVNNVNGATAFQFYRGHRLNLVDGFTINGVTGWVSHGNWTGGTGTWGAAFYAVEAGSGAQIGSSIRINKMYYGLLADHAASFTVVNNTGDVTPLTINEAGDVGMLARWSGSIDGQNTVVTNAADTQQGIGNLGCGYMAEAGGTLRADGSTTSGDLVCGFGSQTGAAAWYHSVTASNANVGLFANGGGSIDSSSVTITGGVNGIQSNDHSHIYSPGANVSGASGSCITATNHSELDVGGGATVANCPNGATEYGDSMVFGTVNSGGGITFNTFVNGNALAGTTLVATGQASLGGATGSEALRAVTTANAVNWVQVQGSTTGNWAEVKAQGSDTNINFHLASKGTSAVIIGTGGGQQVQVNDTPGATNAVTLSGSNGGIVQIGATAGPGVGFNTLAFLKGYTVSTLPTCNATNKGAWAAVSDANAPTYNATVASGGAVQIPVYCNGTNWTAH